MPHSSGHSHSHHHRHSRPLGGWGFVEDVDRYGYFERVPLAELESEAEMSALLYEPRPSLKDFALRAHQYAPKGAMIGADPANDLPVSPSPSLVPGFADTLTLSSFALGIWWCVGGPAWAALASILLDELDGRYARATGTTSERGALLDWGADVTLTPMALMRLGINVGIGPIAIVAAPALLYTQAHLKSGGYRPEVGSARAVIMLAGVAAGM